MYGERCPSSRKDVLVKERHISQEEAETILRQMKQQQRYQRDVY